MVQKMDYIWMDGALVPWDEANVHVLTYTLHYGVGVFEGIRAYECEGGKSAVFRLPEHIKRLFESAKIMQLDVPFSEDEITTACLSCLAENGMKNGYLRPLVYIGAGNAMGVHPAGNPVRVSIAAWPWGAYLGDDALAKGIRIAFSSYTRHHVNVMMTKAKACGNYANSALAKMEAVANGYDEALMLDPDGYVAEGSGENLFLVKNGVIKTPPLTSILEGITRHSVMTLARDLDIPVVEERFTRDYLYTADEAFFTGTAAEITPIREVDRRTIGAGEAGPLTRKLQAAFFDVVKGVNGTYSDWLTYY